MNRKLNKFLERVFQACFQTAPVPRKRRGRVSQTNVIAEVLEIRAMLSGHAVTVAPQVSPPLTNTMAPTANQAPAIASAASTAFMAGTAGSFTVKASGYPAPAFTETGSLPTGVTLSSAGVLSSTTATPAGKYTFTITASNGVGTAATQSFTLNVNQAPAITSATSTAFTAGTAGSFTVKATGFPAPTFTETGTLPTGVTFSTAGVLTSTTATPAGKYTFTITASNGIGTAATQSFTLNVSQGPAITSAASTAFTAGTSGSFTVNATGFPAPTFTETGTLPTGVTFSTAGVLTSTTATPAGKYTFTITASNGVGTAATQSFTLNVNQAPAITSAASATFTAGTASSFTVTATGFPAPTFTETGALPTGVTFSTAGVLTSTTATPAGTYSFTVTASNGIGTAATQTFTLNVSQSTKQAPAITSAATASFLMGAAGSVTLTASGFPAPTFTETGTLPAGVTLSSAGVLSASATTPGGQYTFTLIASNGVGTAATQSFTLSIIDHPAAAATYSAVNGTLFGSNGPRFTDVQQGAVGDCWLMSSLAAVAARYPSDITNMFKSVGTAVENGVTVNLYNVRLYDTTGKAEYLTVDSELPAGGTYYDFASAGVLWVALAEKAYVQANALGYVTTQYAGQDSYNALNGGLPMWALQAITNQPQAYSTINSTNIAADWNSGKIICLSSSASANDNLIVGDATGTHAYAVVGYNASSSTPFELYNPWGASPTLNGLISYNGGSVYGGAFYASAALISSDFAYEFLSSGISHRNLAPSTQDNIPGNLPVSASSPATDFVNSQESNSKPDDHASAGSHCADGKSAVTNSTPTMADRLTGNFHTVNDDGIWN